jgi:hypothetical protein
MERGKLERRGRWNAGEMERGKEVAKCRTGERMKVAKWRREGWHRWRGGCEERITELARLEQQMAKAMRL